MAVAETAEMAVRLSLDSTKFSQAVNRIDRRLGAFSGAVNRNLGRALDAGISKGITVLTDAFKGGIEALREDKIVAAQTEAVLRSTGGAAGITAKQVEDLATQLSTLNAVQDNVVQGTENVILRFTNIGKDIFPAVTQAALDMAAATGTDASAAAVKLGRALDDPIKGVSALTRLGVSFNDKEKATIANLVKHNKLSQAQAIVLGKVKQKFDGVAQAQAKADPGRGLALSVERLQKAFAKNLLPVVEKVQTKLAAFFENPQTVASVQKIGDTIAALFSDQNLNTAASAIGTAATAVKVALDAFNSLPPEVKALAIGAFTINKVTGGALGGLVGALTSIVGKGIGKIFANSVTVIGKTVTGGGGGLPGGGGGGAAGAAGELAPLGLAAFLGTAAAGGAIGVVAATIEKGITDALTGPIHDLTGLSTDRIGAGADQSRNQTFLGPIAALTDLPGTVNKMGDAVGQLSTFINSPHPDFLGDLGNLLTLQHAPGAPATPGGRDMDKNLATAAQVLGNLQANGIDLKGIAGARLANLGVTERQVNGSIRTLKEKLGNVISAEGRATRAGDSRHANALAAKEAAIRGQLSAANAKLAQIRAKKTSLVANTVVNVNTSVAVSELKRQARYSSKVARTTALAAS